MPIYEYHCQDCQSRFEALVPYAHRDEVACEECGQQHVTRLASVFASAASEDGASAVSVGSCCGGSCSCCGD